MRPSPAIVIMGPSGSGKTTLACALADRLQTRFIEADELHASTSVQKMRSGIPLDDADREPWLDAVAQAICASPSGAVVSCSALKRGYRDRLRNGAGPLVFVLLQVPPEVLARRLADRQGHYMPPSLLASQLAALQPLATDEAGFTIDGCSSTEQQLALVQSNLQA